MSPRCTGEVSTWGRWVKRYGASSTTLPFSVRLLLTFPFAFLLLSDLGLVVRVGFGPAAAITTFFLLLTGFAMWTLVPHLWVPSDRTIRDERRDQIVARRLRQELALHEAREPGSDFDDVPTGPWHRRPSAPTRW